MPIREEAFRIGCGRYIQGPGYIGKTADEVLKVGRTALIIGGKTALEKAGKKIEESIKGKVNKYEFFTHTGTCNDEDAMKYANYTKENGYDVIIGVGGGVICDFSKVCGNFSGLPVINIPTSSATCAAYTPLSVCYTPEGKTVGTRHYEHEVSAVIVDTEVMLDQPVRLLLAGVFDSLAKFIEIKQRFDYNDADSPIGLDYAYTLSKRTYKVLNEETVSALDAMRRKEINDSFEKVIFATIATTGVISGIARGSNQCALAHKFYEITRTLFPKKARPYLHGEIVGVGLILQNHFNGESANNTELISLMQKYNMPYRITDIGIDTSPETFADFYESLCASSAVNSENEEECRCLKDSLDYLWGINSLNMLCLNKKNAKMGEKHARLYNQTN